MKQFELDTFKGIAKYNIIEVWWLDAQHGTDIIFPDELKLLKPLLTKNIGYLIEDNKDYIILAYMIFGNDGIKHWQCIPNGMIVKKRYFQQKLNEVK